MLSYNSSPPPPPLGKQMNSNGIPWILWRMQPLLPCIMDFNGVSEGIQNSLAARSEDLIYWDELHKCVRKEPGNWGGKCVWHSTGRTLMNLGVKAHTRIPGGVSDWEAADLLLAVLTCADNVVEHMSTVREAVGGSTNVGVCMRVWVFCPIELFSSPHSITLIEVWSIKSFPPTIVSIHVWMDGRDHLWSVKVLVPDFRKSVRAISHGRLQEGI